jgi:hypothetical protein
MDRQDGQDKELKHESITINFGNPKLEFKRFTRSSDFKHG